MDVRSKKAAYGCLIVTNYFVKIFLVFGCKTFYIYFRSRNERNKAYQTYKEAGLQQGRCVTLCYVKDTIGLPQNGKAFLFYSLKKQKQL